MKITAKFRASRRLRFEDTKRIVSPEIRPKSFGTFEKQAPGVRFSKDPKTLRARKAIRKTPTRLFCKAGFLYVVKGIKIKITAKFCDTEHSRFEDTKRIISPEKFRVFRETGPWIS